MPSSTKKLYASLIFNQLSTAEMFFSFFFYLVSQIVNCHFLSNKHGLYVNAFAS